MLLKDNLEKQTSFNDKSPHLCRKTCQSPQAEKSVGTELRPLRSSEAT